MKIQVSAFLLAVTASSSGAFMSQSGYSAARTALQESSLDTFSLPSIDDEVSDCTLKMESASSGPGSLGRCNEGLFFGSIRSLLLSIFFCL
jgi:hypothetical protein